MKALTIKEPYATAIKKGYKKIETRSYKINYRGKLYIHAGKAAITIKMEEIKKRFPTEHFHHGELILECNLVDCIYMEEAWIEKLKQENPLEYLLGDYQVGRYAWILENIKPLKKQIPINGQLGIWNIKEDILTVYE